MACELWAGKLDAYFDGELPPDEARALAGTFARMRRLLS